MTAPRSMLSKFASQQKTYLLTHHPATHPALHRNNKQQVVVLKSGRGAASSGLLGTSEERGLGSSSWQALSFIAYASDRPRVRGIRGSIGQRLWIDWMQAMAAPPPEQSN